MPKRCGVEVATGEKPGREAGVGALPATGRPAGTRARQGGGLRTARGREPRCLAGRGGPPMGSLGWPAPEAPVAKRGGALGEPRTARAHVRDPRSPGKHARRKGEGGGDSAAEPRAAGGAARSGQAAGGEEEQRRPVGSGHHARSRGADSGGGRTRAAGRRTAGSRGEAGGRVRRELDPWCRGARRR